MKLKYIITLIILIGAGLGLLMIFLRKEEIEFRKPETYGNIEDLAWMNDNVLIFSDGERVMKYDFSIGKGEVLFESENYIYGLLPISPNQIYYFSKSLDQKDFGVFDMNNELVFNVNRGKEIENVTVLQGYKNILIDFQDNKSFIYNLIDKSEVVVRFPRSGYDLEREFFPLVFAKDSNFIFTLQGSTLSTQSLDSDTSEEVALDSNIKSILTKDRFTQSFNISNDLEYLAVVTNNYSVPENREVILFDLESNKVVRKFKFSSYASDLFLSKERLIFTADSKIYSYNIIDDHLSESLIDRTAKLNAGSSLDKISVSDEEGLYVLGTERLEKFFTLDLNDF